jgi:hypothetical protein
VAAADRGGRVEAAVAARGVGDTSTTAAGRNTATAAAGRGEEEGHPRRRRHLLILAEIEGDARDRGMGKSERGVIQGGGTRRREVKREEGRGTTTKATAGRSAAEMCLKKKDLTFPWTR